MGQPEIIVAIRFRRTSAAFVFCLLGPLTVLGQSSPIKPTAVPPHASEPPRHQSNALWALVSRVPEVRYDEAELSEVFAQLSKLMDVNIVVRWQRLEDLGIKKDTPISIAARNMRLSQLLWLIMNQGPLEDVKLAYRVDRDMILISTVEDFDEHLIVKVYPVEDLIAEEPVPPVVSFGRDVPYVSTVRPTVAAGAVAVQPVIERYRTGVTLSGDRNPFDDDEGGAAGEDEDSRERRIRELIDVITNAVEPEHWQVNGGRGTIAPFRNMLVVRASPRVHQLLGGPLTDSEVP